MDADEHAKLDVKTGGRFKLASLIQKRTAQMMSFGVTPGQTGKHLIDKAAAEVADDRLSLMSSDQLLGGPLGSSDELGEACEDPSASEQPRGVDERSVESERHAPSAARALSEGDLLDDLRLLDEQRLAVVAEPVGGGDALDGIRRARSLSPTCPSGARRGQDQAARPQTGHRRPGH